MTSRTRLLISRTEAPRPVPLLSAGRRGWVAFAAAKLCTGEITEIDVIADAFAIWGWVISAKDFRCFACVAFVENDMAKVFNRVV